MWRVEPEVAAPARGRPVLVASHLRDREGRVVAFDGPRSVAIPVDGASHELVVPLAIPDDAGTYFVDLDAVVEGHFWASGLGFQFPSLRVERSTDGTIAAEDTATTQRFRVDGIQRGRFRIPQSSYGAGESERCVEIPWVLSRYRGERRVLDVGTSFAEGRYVEGLRRLPIPALFALDLVPATALRPRAVAGDARMPPLRPGSLDLIFAISVIEHIGRDNAVYLEGRHGPADEDGDFVSIRALGALLQPGGRLLVTVPFGRLEDHGWFVQYDLPRLHRLIGASGLQTDELEFFKYSGAWTGPHPARDLAACSYEKDAVAAAGLACFSLVNERGIWARVRRRLLRRH